uniref:DNA replication ATP-dependent helicase/nuclease DNA2 n=1 Tax=Candidozyma auris TaxID=498019 RepID=A0A0L0NUN0_CANAR
MEKRHNQPLRPQENDLKRSKPRKTTYFFQPQNTLSYKSNKSKNNHESDPSTTKTPQSPLTFPNACLGSLAVLTVKVLPEQSSDDSFEGVRWQGGASPRRKVDTRSILSSPLKNGDRSNSRPAASASLTSFNNEVTDSVLSKYGLGMESILSQTPKSKPLTSKSHIERSPSLTRSKLFDVKCIAKRTPLLNESIPASFSRLNTWIDRFATSPQGHDFPLPQHPHQSKHLLRLSSHDLQVPSNANQEPNNIDDDEDLFSDDDSLLATLDVEQFTKNSKSRQSSNDVLSEAPNNQIQTADDTDPFSDDLNIIDLESKVGCTNVPSKANSTEDELLERLLQSGHVANDEDVGAKISFSRSDFVRYQIMSVLKSQFVIQNLKRKQLILTVRNKESVESRLIVRGDAAELSLEKGDIIHVILTAPETPKLVDNTHNLLIWNPDVLVSSTVVADQLFCPRKTVIMRRYNFPGEPSIPLIVGTTVHEIFQTCFVSEKFDNDYLEMLLENTISTRKAEIFSLGDIAEEVENKVREHLPFIKHWFETFYRKVPSTIPTNQRNQKINFSVADGLDLEESIWSPMFGIKGNVDVTLRAIFRTEHTSSEVLLPMEIKTSRPFLSHQAQAALYSLLFKDRYNVDISSFLLVYTLEEGLTRKYDISVADLKSLVHLRNQISLFLKSGQNDLPDLMRQQKCDRCSIQEACMTMNYMVEGGTADESGLNDGVYEDITMHLENKPHYATYFKYWDELLTREEHFMTKFNRDLWVYTSKEREAEQGNAIASLVISTCKEADDGLFYYTFVRKPGATYTSMQITQIARFDRVVISDDDGHFALCQGSVYDIRPDAITVGTRRRIIPTTLKTDKFHRAKVLKKSQSTSQSQGSQVIFRIDKDEMFYGMGVARFNLLNLFSKSGDSKRRSLIVDSNPPQFLECAERPDFNGISINPDQENAIMKVLQSKDYSLILGMPGTGKTTVIAYLIKILVGQNKTVLLSSYTNSAVDNILLKLKDLDIKFARFGNPSRMHHEIRKFVPGSAECPLETYQDFERLYKAPAVFAATALGIRDLAFNIRDQFDYCIIDESSQVSMPLSLGPLALCDKFVLVGDHYQLPPLVKHPDPEVKRGLSRSLFQILAEKHPESVCELTYQYRMCEEIMFLSNSLVYGGRLKCGSETVANQTLKIPRIDELLKVVRNTKCEEHWLHRIFEEKTRCLFLNHDASGEFEMVTGESVTNLLEVELIKDTVEGLCACGVDENDIGIMTLYRSQLRLLNHAFKHRPALEILTADRFQGRDKQCIIISLVRSNKDRKAGELVKDLRRINVALTRARSKLLIFGSLSTLSNTSAIKDFIKLFRARNWIYNLPVNARSVYDFGEKEFTGSDENVSQVKKLSEKLIMKHPISRDILHDMDVNIFG